MSEYRIVFLGMRQSSTEGILGSIWKKIKADGLVKRLFYDGNITTEMLFIDMLMQPEVLPFIVFRDDEFALFAWLNGMEGNSMRMHFTMFKGSWGRKRHATSIGRHILSYILTRKDSKGFLIDTVLGLTPLTNKLACRFVQLAGMQKIGIIPHCARLFYYNAAIDDGLLTYATRETLGLHGDYVVEDVWSA